jgi:hypothetical protein
MLVAPTLDIDAAGAREECARNCTRTGFDKIFINLDTGVPGALLRIVLGMLFVRARHGRESSSGSLDDGRSFAGNALRYQGICRRGASSRVGIVRLAFATILKRNEKLPNVLIPCRFGSQLKPLRYTNRRGEEFLGWRPPFDYAECLRRTYGPSGPA